MVVQLAFRNAKIPLPILVGVMIFGAVGLLIVYFAVLDGVDTWRFIDDAAHARGVVEDITTRYSETGTGANRSRNLTNLAMIRFADMDGAIVHFEHTYGLWEGTLASGQKVDVAYQPGQSRSARIDSFPALWAGNIAMLVCGGLFIGAAVVVYRVFGSFPR